jgi:hypothetical protein
MKDLEIPGIIPLNEYIPEIEKDVAYHVRRIGDVRKVVKKIERAEYPTKFSDKREELDFQLQEIKRCIHGHGQLSGKMYFWYNYCMLRDPERGKIRPDFRTIDLEWFEHIEKLQASKEYGMVTIKRRRVGASWKAAADALHDCTFKPFFQVGMNSKSENDSRNMFKHVKFIYQNLPDWLRPKATASDRRDFMEFAWYEKDATGNRTKRGNQSWILSVAPTENAHEGNAYGKLIMDEAGKYDVMSMWQYSEDCLMLNTRRVGMPLVFGTVGDITKEGRGLMEMWKNSEAYKMKQFGLWGYNGLIVDAYGNDMIEDAVRWILYERRLKESATKRVREAFIQKYPLDERDAFNQVSAGGVGDIKLINDQILHLMGNPPKKMTGWMRPKPDGGVDFVPTPNGEVIVYERPDHSRSNGYKATVDPAEDDDVAKTRDSSEIALSICSRPFGEMPAKLVLELSYRPEKLDEFYEQAAMCLIWYNDTKVQIEMNKGGWRMRKYFEEHYPNLLALAPVSATSAKGGVEWRIGVKMTTDRKNQMMGLIDDYVDNYVKFIPSIKMLNQFKVFGDLHADDDLAVTFGWNLILMQADKTVTRKSDESTRLNPTVSYKNVGGRIILVTPQNQNNLPQTPKRIKSALFRY